MQSLLKNCEFAKVSDAVAAGTTDANSASVNMSNAKGVAFVVHFGTITANAVTSVKLQQSDDDGATDGWSDLEGTAITVADDDDDQLVIAEIWRPLKKYVRAVVDRGTQNAVIASIIAIKYGLRVMPATQPATVAGGEVAASPAEGTA